MKAQYISTASRAKKIIATIWMSAISLSCVIVPFVTGVSTNKLNPYINVIRLKCIIKWYEGVIMYHWN